MLKEKKYRWDAIIERLPKDVEIHGVEIGVWTGKTSEQLLKQLPKLQLSLVDRWCVTPKGDSYFEGSRVMSRHDQKRFDKAFNETLGKIAPYKDRVTVYKMHSIQASEHFKDGSLDFIFIDGDHSYEGVTADLKAWVRKVKPNGLICGHDWDNDNTYQDVKNAVLDYFGRDKDIELSYNKTWFIRTENGKQKEKG